MGLGPTGATCTIHGPATEAAGLPRREFFNPEKIFRLNKTFTEADFFPRTGGLLPFELLQWWCWGVGWRWQVTAGRKHSGKQGLEKEEGTLELGQKQDLALYGIFLGGLTSGWISPLPGFWGH